MITTLDYSKTSNGDWSQPPSLLAPENRDLQFEDTMANLFKSDEGDGVDGEAVVLDRPEFEEI